jgi:hypothetical protein
VCLASPGPGRHELRGVYTCVCIRVCLFCVYVCVGVGDGGDACRCGCGSPGYAFVSSLDIVGLAVSGPLKAASPTRLR